MMGCGEACIVRSFSNLLLLPSLIKVIKIKMAEFLSFVSVCGTHGNSYTP